MRYSSAGVLAGVDGNLSIGRKAVKNLCRPTVKNLCRPMVAIVVLLATKTRLD